MNTFKKIKVWAHDYLYMVHGAMSTLVYIKPPAHYQGYVVDGKVPVVIIPGILGKWSFMKKNSRYYFSSWSSGVCCA
jgi:hypothetical protein